MSSASKAEKPGLIRSLPKFVAGMFTRNLAAKTAALVLAILVWYTLRQELTAKETFRAYLRVDIEDPEVLMLTEPPPTHVEVVLEGPRSQISSLRQQENAEVRIRVDEDLLSGQLSAQPKFSPSRGNVEHGYGTDVVILEMEPAEIELSVAIRARAEVEVLRPEVRLPSTEWSVDLFDLVTTKVRLMGPKDVLDATASFRPPPIDAAEILTGVDTETVGPIERPLELPADLLRRGVRLEPGQDRDFRYGATFVRSRAREPLVVPFVVFFEKDESSVRLVPKDGELLERKDEGFVLPIVFKGTPSSLRRLAEYIEEGRVRAYVRAEEFDLYEKGQIGSANPTTQIHVEIPKELWGRVDYEPPDPRRIYLETEEK